jgi:signal transduction histidine kinase
VSGEAGGSAVMVHAESGRGLARPLRFGLGIGGGVLGVIAFIDATSRGVPSDVALATLIAYSWVYLGAGAIAWERRPTDRIGGLMTAVGLCAATLLAFDPTVPILAFVPVVVVPLMNTFLIWLLLSYPTGRLGSRVEAATAVAVGVAIGVVNLLARTVGPEVVPLGPVVLASLSIWTLFLILRRWRRASPPARRTLAPMVVAGVLVTILFTGESLAAIAGIPTELGTPFRWGMLVARATVPIAFLVGLLRMQIARAAVADLIVGLDVGQIDRLRASLAGALGDPTLDVLLWSAPGGRYVDGAGTFVDPPTASSDRGVILLERDGQPLGAIVHDPALAGDPGLVSAVSATVRMAVDNERLAAAVRDQLDEVRASRMRIVEAGDAERRRVERNLHDGAQQRLVALSLALRRAEGQIPSDADPELASTLHGATEQLASALSELRTLARGIHPAILTEAGLGPALRSLARDSAVPVTVEIELDDRLPAAIEAAAYYVVAESLANVAKYADAGAVRLEVRSTDERLEVEVADDGIGGADAAAGSGLRGLQDRVAAIGGTLEIDSPPGVGTRLVASLPVDSATTR